MIAIYSRKSRFTGKGDSIGNQVELCRNYISAAYGPEAAETALVFEDEGFSGGNLDRPDFQRMMEAARAGTVTAVVVYRLDRISRNIGDFASLIDKLTKLHIAFFSIREQFDTETPMGRAMMYIASVFSQLERETIAERIRDNMRQLSKTGRWLGGRTPTGYRSESVPEQGKRHCRLSPVPEEGALVRKIFSLYRQTESLTQVEAMLLQQGCKTREGREFSRFAVKSILENPVYAPGDGATFSYFEAQGAELCSPREAFDGTRGILAYNRTHQEKGHATRFLPVRQWIIALGEHPPLVDSETWLTVQRALEKNRNRSYRRPRTTPALLTGLLRCQCGSPMYPKGTGDHFSYRCRRKDHSKQALCTGPNLPGPLADALVWQKVRHFSEDVPYFLELLQEIPLTGPDPDREIEQCTQKLRNLVESLSHTDDPKVRDLLLHRMEELEAQRLALTPSHPAPPKAPTLADFLSTTDISRKRRVLKSLFSEIRWDGETLTVQTPG